MSSDTEYVVERIVTHTVDKSGTTKYKIKWKGYEETSWEPEENLTGCRELLRQYKRKTKNITPINPTRPIVEVKGIKRGSPAGNIMYYVLFEGDNKVTELSSAKLREVDPQKLIDMYERALPVNEQEYQRQG